MENTVNPASNRIRRREVHSVSHRSRFGEPPRPQCPARQRGPLGAGGYQPSQRPDSARTPVQAQSRAAGPFHCLKFAGPEAKFRRLPRETWSPSFGRVCVSTAQRWAASHSNQARIGPEGGSVQASEYLPKPPNRQVSSTFTFLLAAGISGDILEKRLYFACFAQAAPLNTCTFVV